MFITKTVICTNAGLWHYNIDKIAFWGSGTDANDTVG